MIESLQEIFSMVCAQNSAHTWAPGGELLPLCQRCTGFYTGAALALALLLVFRPKPDGRFRQLHLALVLAMTPFGFHLVPQEELLRTVSGYWFGFGVVGLLWLLPARRFFPRLKTSGVLLPLCWGAPGLVLLPVMASRGGHAAALLLSWLAAAGWLGLAGLVLANTAVACSWCLRAPRLAREG